MTREGSVLRLLLPVAAIVLLLGLVGGCVTPRSYSSSPIVDGADLIRVGTFNVRQRYGDGRRTDWEFRKNAVIEVIRTENPDILGLQEVNEEGYDTLLPSVQLADLEVAFPDYEFIGAGDPREKPSENPILIRRGRFDCVDEGTVFFSRTPDVPYSVAWRAGRPVYGQWAVVVDTDTSRRIGLVNVHYDHLSGASKRNASRIISEFLASGMPTVDAVVVLGDFNAFHASVSLATLRNAGLRDALGFTPTGTFHMFTGITPWPRIDHILVSEDVEVHDAYICYLRPNGVLPSDHFPVFADLSF